MKNNITLLTIIFFIVSYVAFPQSTCINIDADPFGDAIITSDFEYVVTKKQTNQIGGFWGNSTISLDEDFDFSFRIFLGDNDGGADGVAFLLRGVGSNSQGSSGGGVGYQGITPSFAVEFDTYANGSNADPSQDHTAIQLNGNPNHNDSNANIFGPVSIGSGGNVEDNAYHEVRFVWEATTNTFTYYFDGNELTKITNDLRTIFGTNEVIWGFTGSTGGFFNEQKICALTAINSNLDKDKDGILDSIECDGSINCADLDNDTEPNNEDLDTDDDGCFDAFEAGLSPTNTEHPNELALADLVIDTSNGLITNSAIINANGGYHATKDDLPDLNNNNVPDFLEAVDLNYTQQPTNQTVVVNNNISFSFTSSNPNLNIIWEFSSDGTTWNVVPSAAPYSGVTTNTLTITNATDNLNNYQYRAVIEDSNYTCAGINESNPATLTVAPPPDSDLDNDGVLDTIECRGINPCPDDDGDTVPNNQDLDSDEDGCFDAYEAGLSSVNSEYPDSLDPANITEDANGLVTNSTTINNNGGYFTNESQFPDLNANGVIDLLDKADLTFTNQPDNQSIEATNNVTFEFSSNNSNLTIIWQVSTDNGNTWIDLTNTAPYSGVTTNTLTITNVPLNFNNNQYRAQISDNIFTCAGTKNTNEITLTVVPPPDQDLDNDGVLDSIECRGITPCPNDDGDRFPNNEDLDSDGDGCFDAEEAGLNSNNGYPDSLDPANIVENIHGLITNSTTIINNGGYYTNENQFPDLNANGKIDLLDKFEFIFNTETSNLTVNEGENASFTFDVNNNATINWEESTDNGTTWNLLSNNNTYSGTDTKTLTITNVSVSMNSNLYRATVTSLDTEHACKVSASNQAKLNVFINIKVPNGFSPNNDGINDTFVIDDLKHFSKYILRIYNRNGGLVYTGIANTPPWNGIPNETILGKGVVASGVYFYVLDVNEEGYKPLQGYIHVRK